MPPLLLSELWESCDSSPKGACLRNSPESKTGGTMLFFLTLNSSNEPTTISRLLHFYSKCHLEVSRTSIWGVNSICDLKVHFCLLNRGPWFNTPARVQSGRSASAQPATHLSVTGGTYPPLAVTSQVPTLKGHIHFRRPDLYINSERKKPLL